MKFGASEICETAGKKKGHIPNLRNGKRIWVHENEKMDVDVLQIEIRGEIWMCPRGKLGRFDI